MLQSAIRKLDLKMTASELERQVRVNREKDTSVLRIRVTASDPREAKVIAQTLAEEFLACVDELNKQEIKTTRTFLEEQLDQANKELLEAKKRLHVCKQATSSTVELKKLLLDCSEREKTYLDLARQVDDVRVQEKRQNKLGSLTLMGPPQDNRGRYGLIQWVRMKFGSLPDADH